MVTLSGFGGPTGFGELAIIERNDDNSSNLLNLPYEINFYGDVYQNVYINNNGNISFNDIISSFTPTPFPVAEQPMIAPYWADVDTRNEESGQVYFATPDEDTFVVTWDSVGYYNNRADLTNTFQVVLRDRSMDTGNSGDFDIEFRYDSLEWTSGEASGGIDGLGGDAAQVGFDAGNLEDFFVLPGSFTNEVLDLQNTSNVSTDTPGLWTFAIRGGETPGTNPTNPLLPVITEEGFNFDFQIQDPSNQIWIDPEIAIGYNYIVNSGPNISTVEIPFDLTGPDGVYNIFVSNGESDFIDSGFDIGTNEVFSFVDNGFTEGVSSFSIRGIDPAAELAPNDSLAFVTGLQFVSEGLVDLNQNPLTIDIAPIYRFQNTAVPGTYLFAGEEESNSIKQNFPEFQEEGFAFNVAVEPGDDLIAFNRFQNTAVPGTYLYAGEEESQSIRQNFPNFVEEGIAFYAYGSDANQGTDFYRFQNTQQPGTYIFVGQEERQNILANFPNFREEGIAFEAIV